MKQRAPAVVLACDSQLLSPVSEKSTCHPVLSVCTHCGSGSCQCAPWQPVGPTYIHTCETVRKKMGRVSYTDHFTSSLQRKWAGGIFICVGAVVVYLYGCVFICVGAVTCMSRALFCLCSHLEELGVLPLGVLPAALKRLLVGLSTCLEGLLCA